MTTHRNSEATRQRLLRAAFREFHRNGFRGADLERILREAGVTKGALYYHFQSKKGLGYSVVEEVLGDWILDRWIRPLEAAVDPVAALGALAKWGEQVATPEGLSLGCPLNNLSQELCGEDEGFRRRLAAVYESWHEGLVELLIRSQKQGAIRPDVDVHGAATFVIAAWEGSIGLAKSHPTSVTLRRCRRGLETYLESLASPLQRSELPIA